VGSSSAFSIFYTNSGDLRNKLPELITVSNTYKNCKVICVTETKFHSEILDAEINIPNFTVYRSDRANGKSGGGSCIYVNNAIRASRIENFNANDSIAVLIDMEPSPILLVCVYRTQALTWEENQELVTQINSLEIPPGGEMVVIGDFNMPDVEWNTGVVKCPLSTVDKRFVIQQQMIDMFYSKNLSWIFDDDTVTRRRLVDGVLQESLLDQVLVTNLDIVRNTRVVAPLGKSDHVGILCDIRCKNNFDLLASTKNVWAKFKVDDIAALGNAVDWQYSSDSLSAEDMWNELSDKLLSISSNVPQSVVRKNSNGTVQTKAPWECTALKRKRREKDKFWAVFQESPTKGNLNTALSKQSEFDKKLSDTLIKYEKKITSNMKHNPKQFFGYLNSKRKIKSGVSELKDKNGNLCEKPLDNANILGNFFASTFVLESQDSNFISQDSEHIKIDINEISDIVFSMDEVMNYLSHLNIYKSGGPDQIHPKMLKTLSKNSDFILAITNLFNECVASGSIPKVWKTAQVTALHKKGPKWEACNYRPISLTCILCKVFEKVVRNHVMNHFLPFVSDTQHGFLKGKSCLSNLFECFDKIDEIVNDGGDVDILYLDFQKAFDTVPHKRLIHKLKSYGITGKTLDIITDFLSSRTFRVRVGDTLSDVFKVTSGVPQGSVLGPLLFLIFINDIPNGIKSFLLLFADDLKLIVNANLKDVTQKDLDLLSEWQKKWLLSFNTTDSKCKVLSISKSGTRENINKYYLNDGLLPNVAGEKDLGVNIESNLGWGSHIQSNISKAKQCIGWVKRNVISRNAEVMVNIYKSLIRPHLEYCVQLWSPKPEHGNWATIMELESVQREFTRLIDGVGLLTYKERLDKLKLTTLIERRARGDLIEVFKIFRGLCMYGKTLLKFSRSGMNIVLKSSCPGVNKFELRVVSYWNKLPDELKMVDTVTHFKIGLEVYKKDNISKEGNNYWDLADEVYSRIDDSNRQNYVIFMKENEYIARRRGINTVGIN
jgi:hypothetical protein